MNPRHISCSIFLLKGVAAMNNFTSDWSVTWLFVGCVRFTVRAAQNPCYWFRLTFCERLLFRLTFCERLLIRVSAAVL